MKSCPKGYTCDPKQETCQLNDSDMKTDHPFTKLVVSKIKNNRMKLESVADVPDESVECADTIHFCPDKFTCCPTLDKSNFGCCPIDNAVCCDDGINW